LSINNLLAYNSSHMQEISNIHLYVKQKLKVKVCYLKLINNNNNDRIKNFLKMKNYDRTY